MLNLSNSPLVAYTGRIKNFLEDKEQERGILPMACTLIKPDGSSLHDLLYLTNYLIIALKTAAGINVHLDNLCFDKAGYLGSFRKSKLYFALDYEHPAWEELKQLSPEDEFFKLFDKGTKILKGESPVEENNQVIEVQDSLSHDMAEKGTVSLIDTFGVIARELKAQKTVIVNLSNVRPKGVKTKRVESSGPLSFAELYLSWLGLLRDFTVENLLSYFSIINGNIRKGGSIYKNGALTTSMPCYHPDFEDYIEADPATVHPWVKKGAVLTTDWREFYPFTVMEKVNEGTLWLEKALVEVDGKKKLISSVYLAKEDRLLTNVCREILMDSRGTCSLLPYNLGQCKDTLDIEDAMEKCMSILINMHKEDYPGQTGIYLSTKVDRQVGVEPLGLANILANNNIKYSEFLDALQDDVNYFTDQVKANGVENICQLYELKPELFEELTNSEYKITALSLSEGLFRGYAVAGILAHKYKLDRAFCVAPTATVAFRHKDRLGFTTVPEIAPPVSRVEERVTDVQASAGFFQYPNNVELASDLGPAGHFQLADLWQQMMELTGLAHSISFNVVEDCNEEFIDRYMNSAIINTYYRRDITDGFQDKSNPMGLSCTKDVCAACDAS